MEALELVMRLYGCGVAVVYSCYFFSGLDFSNFQKSYSCGKCFFRGFVNFVLEIFTKWNLQKLVGQKNCGYSSRFMCPKLFL